MLLHIESTFIFIEFKHEKAIITTKIINKGVINM